MLLRGQVHAPRDGSVFAELANASHADVDRAIGWVAGGVAWRVELRRRDVEEARQGARGQEEEKGKQGDEAEQAEKQEVVAPEGLPVVRAEREAVASGEEGRVDGGEEDRRLPVVREGPPVVADRVRRRPCSAGRPTTFGGVWRQRKTPRKPKTSPWLTWQSQS